MGVERHQRNPQSTLAHVIDLLDKQALVAGLATREGAPRQDLVQSLLAKQHSALLERYVQGLHPADVACVLEGLPPARRQIVWSMVAPGQRGAVLIELADGVRDALLGAMGEAEIIGAAQHLGSEEIADLVPSLPQETVARLMNALDREGRTEVQTVLGFPAGSVGSLMELDPVTVRDDVSLEVVLRFLRRRGALPPATHELLVVDRQGELRGTLSLVSLVLHDPEVPVSMVMQADPLALYSDEQAEQAVSVFERYDLVAAPVVNRHQRLVGVLRVDAVVDFLRASAQEDQLKQVGLRGDEDLYAPVLRSSRNRSTWLALNLMTAFIASRVIGMFEATIAELVALAALMPIVASVGGNTGNQTAALVIRGLALRQVSTTNLRFLLGREVAIALLNGTVWGLVVGLFALAVYGEPALALVMWAAVMLNLVIAALAGVFIPIGLERLGRDPVLGSSVMLTALTDCMGFLIFLGLAALVLL